MTTKINGNTIIHGIRNSAAFNVRPEGDETWFSSRERRDAALRTMRARARICGLAHEASLAGIVPIKSTAAAPRREGIDIDSTLACDMD